MRVAVCCGDGVLGDAIGALLAYRGDFAVVGRSADIRSCVSLAKEGGADVLVIHSHAIDPTDLGFLSGAKTYGDFRTVLLLDNGRPTTLGSVAEQVVRSAGRPVLVIPAIV